MAEQNDIPVAGPVGKESIQGSSARPEVVREDEGIFCPICNYNLSGVFSGRCPECGALFDRERLLDTQQAHRITLIPWDDPREMPLFKRIWETLKVTLISPDRFAHAFSVQPQRSSAGLFWLGSIVFTQAIVAGTALFGAMIDGRFSRSLLDEIHLRTVPLAVLTLAPLVSILGTTILAAMLLWTTFPHFDGKRHFIPWLNICAYAASHYLLMIGGVIILLAVWLGAGEREFFVTMLAALPLPWLGCNFLSHSTIRAVVARRCPARSHAVSPGFGLSFAYLAFPFVVIFMTLLFFSQR